MTTSEYNKCVDLFSDNIYRFILKNLRKEDESKDIVQESFTKLWLKVDEVDFEKAKSYLFTTAYRTMIDYIRKVKRISDFDTVQESQYSHSNQYSDLNEILHKAINQLPEDQRSVILLRDYEGYGYDEIAEITNLSLAQVKVYIFRGRKYLRKCIGKIENVI